MISKKEQPNLFWAEKPSRKNKESIFIFILKRKQGETRNLSRRCKFRDHRRILRPFLFPFRRHRRLRWWTVASLCLCRPRVPWTWNPFPLPTVWCTDQTFDSYLKWSFSLSIYLSIPYQYSSTSLSSCVSVHPYLSLSQSIYLSSYPYSSLYLSFHQSICACKT